MVVGAHTMCLVALITQKREFFTTVVIFQTVLTAVRPVEAKGAKGFIACQTKYLS